MTPTKLQTPTTFRAPSEASTLKLNRIGARRRAALTSVLAGLVLAGVAGAPAHADESPIEEAARTGNIRIIRPREPAGPPDVLVFRDGRIREAWSLQLRGKTVTYRYLDARGAWFSTRVSKSAIRSIEFGKSLSEYRAANAPQPPEPVRITEAAEQPIRRSEILAGKFVARQGRHTEWFLKFSSEINKFYSYAEKATEYGQFFLRSHHRKPNYNGLHQENEVIAKGRYFLYAPGTMGNDDWVLNLTRVVYLENDISPRKAFFSERFPDEVFIVKFLDEGRGVELKWANQSGWSWSAPAEQTFRRVGEPPTRILSKSPERRDASAPARPTQPAERPGARRVARRDP